MGIEPATSWLVVRHADQTPNEAVDRGREGERERERERERDDKHLFRVLNSIYKL